VPRAANCLLLSIVARTHLNNPQDRQLPLPYVASTPMILVFAHFTRNARRS
jgi:hypothetical protein